MGVALSWLGSVFDKKQRRRCYGSIVPVARSGGKINHVAGSVGDYLAINVDDDLTVQDVACVTLETPVRLLERL